MTVFVHDLGGPIGLAMAGRRPERVRASIVSQAFARLLREYPIIDGMLRFLRSGPSR